MYERAQVQTIVERLSEEDNPLIQIVVGPRQTGKSTMIAQALRRIETVSHYVSADDAFVRNTDWLSTEWQQARNMTHGGERPAILVVDEVQKIPHWHNVVKSLWDADRRNLVPLKVVLSGSSSLLLHKGMEDSLMGRFELIRSPHWTLSECNEAFDFDLDTFLHFGGYPGAARLVKDEARWRTYMRDAVIEPTIAQDVLELENVRKPALMRQVFALASLYSGQELSYNKMLGQLQDAGNTVTIAQYLSLLDKAGMVAALHKFDPKELKMRRSSPRLMVYDTSLMTAVSSKGRRLLEESDLRGHLVESAVGAYLLGRSGAEGFDVRWWRKDTDEVDFVLTCGTDVTAIEVKDGKEKRQSGMGAFLKNYPEAKRIIVGGGSSGACKLDDFLHGEVGLFW